jgi:hypothetical protein
VLTATRHLESHRAPAIIGLAGYVRFGRIPRQPVKDMKILFPLKRFPFEVENAVASLVFDDILKKLNALLRVLIGVSPQGVERRIRAQQLWYPVWQFSTSDNPATC